MQYNPFKSALWCVLLLMTGVSGRAQDSYDQPKYRAQPFSVGFSLGLADLWADVGASRNIDRHFNRMYWRSTRMAASANFFWTPSSAPWVRLGGGLMYGSFYSTDALNKKWARQDAYGGANLEYLLYLRNLDVQTNIGEISIGFQIEPLRIAAKSKPAFWRVQPYLGAGVAAFRFNPKGTYTDPVTGSERWVNLHDLRLEGEGSGLPETPAGYSLTQLSFPLSAGVRFELSESWRLQVEYSYRYTLTDYLDGVSNRYIDPKLFDLYLSPEDAAIARAMADKTYLIDPTVTHPPGDIRGNPKKKDGYSTFSIGLSYCFGSRRQYDLP